MYDEKWLKRFMIGPWKEDGDQLSSEKSPEAVKLERELYRLLRQRRTELSETLQEGIKKSGIC